MEFLSQSDLARLLPEYGYAFLAAIVGLESIGIPLPGETTLIAAALIAGTTHELNIWLVIAAAAAGAIIGDNIGFWIGRRFGTVLLLRFGPRLGLAERRIKLGQYLFRCHGGKVVFFGRFVAVLRALAAVLAGANRMSWPRFLAANAAGGIVWALIYGLAAWSLGKEVTRIATPASLGLGIAALIAIGAGWFFIRRHEADLQARAERMFPGPLRQG